MLFPIVDGYNTCVSVKIDDIFVAINNDEIDGVVDVHSHEAIEEMRRIARVHGIFVGPSSGAHLIAAKRLKEQYNVENVVTFFCDEGEKYINDYWIKK